MKKKSLLFSIIALVLIGATFLLQHIAEKKIADFIKTEVDGLAYQNLDLNLFFGDLKLNTGSFRSPGLKIQFEKLEILDLHYWDFLVKDEIILGEIILYSSRVEQKEIKKDSEPETQTNNFKKTIRVKSLKIKDASFNAISLENETWFSVQNISVEIDSILLDEKKLTQKIPFTYGNFSVTADSFFFDLDKYHHLNVDGVFLSNDQFVVEQLVMEPKYARREFSNMLPYEHDMYRLKIDSIEIKKPRFGFSGEIPFFNTSKLIVSNANFKIFRDKTLPDDPRTKSMYSALLRELDLNLHIKETVVENSFIQYQELIKYDRPLGTVAFYDLNAHIQNIVNTDLNSENFPKTKIKARSQFMNTSDLNVAWEFSINNKMDEFQISGDIQKIPPKAMNGFFVPAMRIKAEGGLQALYFNFSGNKIDAIGDIRLDYNDFSISVLKKDGDEKNKFLSTMANLFVKKNPKNNSVTKEDIQVERDVTKSFWNYFWSCIKKGLLKSMI